jgi:hypothetical protein
LIPDPGAELISAREYPQTWFLLDVLGREPRLLGHEIVDLSPGAIELRSIARSLREQAEGRERWIPFRDVRTLDRLESTQVRRLSFGPEVGYCVERDLSNDVHGGQPIRHLAVRFSSRVLTPATAAEIGLYFYGRRPAVFACTAVNEVHGYIGADWDLISGRDLDVLLRRELHERTP